MIMKQILYKRVDYLLNGFEKEIILYLYKVDFEMSFNGNILF